MDKHSSLLRPFESNEENEVLWIEYMKSYLHNFILFVTYVLGQYVSVT
jgi:hypothetical protein